MQKTSTRHIVIDPYIRIVALHFPVFLAMANSRMFSTGVLLPIIIVAFFGWMPKVEAQCEEYVHVNSSISELGDCICDVTSSMSLACSSGVSKEEFRETIHQLDQQITDVTVELDTLRVTLLRQKEDIIAMNAQMDNINAIKQRIIDNEIVMSRPEYDVIRRDLMDMEKLINDLEEMEADQAIIEELREEMVNITTNLDLLETHNDADVASLLHDIDRLEKKIAKCESDKKLGDNFPYPWDDFKLQDSCGNLVSVSEPYTLRGNLATSGVWFTDPIVEVDKPWYQSTITYTLSIYQYASMEEFLANGLQEIFSLSYYIEGCSAVAYNGSLFYNRYPYPTMIRYDYVDKSVTHTRTLPSAGYTSTYPYLYGGYTSIDFAVDELGLWVIYGMTTDSGLLSISKINDLTLEIEATYTTNFYKKDFGECFMVCGKLYCTDSYNKRDGRIAFMYDTITQTTTTLNIPFNSKYLSTTSLKYNPRDQRLYAYNNGHALGYDLQFQSED